MIHLLLVPESIRVLALVLLNVAITLYLVRIRSKEGATGWLAVFTGGMAVFYLLRFVMSAVFPIVPRSPLDYALGAGEALVVPIALGALVLFAYRFLGDMYPREARFFSWFTLAVIGVMIAVGINTVVENGDPFLWQPLYSLVWLLFSLWATVVLLRKRARSRKLEVRGDRAGASDVSVVTGSLSAARRPSAAFSTFATLCGLFAVLLILIPLVGPVLPNRLWPFILLGIYAFFFGLVAAYVNHAPNPTSFQVKLVGISIAMVLAIFGMTAIMLHPPSEVARFTGVVPNEASALSFAPDSTGGFRAAQEVAFVDGDWGEQVAFDRTGVVHASIGFPFRYMGSTWDSLTIGTSAITVLGVDRNVPRRGYQPYAPRERPAIAAYFVPSFFIRNQPGVAEEADAYVQRSFDRLTITWHMRPIGDDEPLVAQLHLHSDGRIAMRYDHQEKAGPQSPALLLGIRGLLSGRGNDAALPADLQSQRDGVIIEAGQGILEDFGLIAARQMHTPSLRLLILMLVALAFVLLAYPLVFRTSVVRPLLRLQEGMRRVNAGDLGTEIEVGVPDEVGRLTAYFNETTRSLHRADAQLKAYAGTLEDKVDERTAALNRTVEELKATQAQLIHIEKMASLGSLTAGIAHEIKNPLNFVNNFAEVGAELTDELTEAITGSRYDEAVTILAEIKANAEQITNHGQRADRIVQSMMQHARGVRLDREVVDVNSLLDEYINLAWHGMRARSRDFTAELVRKFDPAVGTAELMPQEVGRVVLNLLNNAFDAVRGVEGAEVQICSARTPSGVTITVSDNGPGIPEDIRRKVFEPFFTTKPPGEGTGLGLSLSHDIIANGHGGSMSVGESREGGAEFTITIPAGVSA